MVTRTNTAEFGRLFREARGQQTQDEIDELGGPYRQRQSEIERGDPIDLTPAVLNQIDTAFRWTRGSAETLLTSRDALSEPPAELDTIGPRALGFDTGGREIPMPPKLIVDTSVDLTPLLQRWDGLILIDVKAADFMRTPPAPGDWWPRVVYRTGANEPADAQPIAIDPLAGLTSYRRAWALASLPIPGKHDGGERAALTLLFTAAEMHREGIDGLTALSKLAQSSPVYDSALDRWREFHRASGLTSRLAKPEFKETAALFTGLMAARDMLVEVEISYTPNKPGDNNVTASVPKTVPPSALAGGVLYFDSAVCPELPLVIDWAQTSHQPPPLLLTLTGGRVDMQRTNLPRTRQLLVDPHLYSVGVSDDAAPAVNRPGAATWPKLFKVDSTPKLGTAPNQPTPIYVPAFDADTYLDGYEADARTSRITLGAATAQAQLC